MVKFTHILCLLLVMAIPLSGAAQDTMGDVGADDDHTAREETEGKGLWQQLQNKQITCDALTDEQFAALGEYFMGQMLSESHAAMNQMMIRMMGAEGEEQIHVVMGKRLSSCDTSAVYPMSGAGFMPMMNMMIPLRHGFGGRAGGGMHMMDWGWGLGSGMSVFGWLGGLFMLLWWVLIIVGIVALVKWTVGQGKTQRGGASALDILKGRYAKGEISKQEFEEKKKDIL